MVGRSGMTEMRLTTLRIAWEKTCVICWMVGRMDPGDVSSLCLYDAGILWCWRYSYRMASSSHVQPCVSPLTGEYSSLLTNFVIDARKRACRGHILETT